VAGARGYDGQFAYQIARDPLGASRFSTFRVRYQRILIRSWRGAGGGAGTCPVALVAVNWLALMIGTRFTKTF